VVSALMEKGASLVAVAIILTGYLFN